jgi:hypothetical protein
MLLAVGASLLVTLLVPAAGRADIQTIGPDLAAHSAVAQASSPVDDIFALIAEGAQAANYAGRLTRCRPTVR